MSKIEINLDSTALGSSACILDLVRTIIGELPQTENEIPTAYREKVLNIELVYGIAVHGFLDTMFKTKGHYPTARKKAEELFKIPSISHKKKLWMNDPKHMITTCYQVWSGYVESESTFEVLTTTIYCERCRGVGSVGNESEQDMSAALVCDKCRGTGTVDGPATEITFRIKYYEDDYIILHLCGTIDTIGKFKNGCYAIRDWKTTGSWDNDGYFEQYQLSRQLRFYTLACKLMAHSNPESLIGKVGSSHMGAFIDGIFLAPNANETKCKRSDVYSFSQKSLDAFQMTLDDKIQEISRAVKTGYLPKQGILNGACEAEPDGMRKFQKCKFWTICKSDDVVGGVLLKRDFIRKPFNPLAYNE